MQPALDLLTTALLGIGSVVALTGSAGVLRFPEFYSRLHASGKTDSLAQVLIMTALLLQTPRYPALAMNAGPRLVMITLFILFTSPVATHAITKAARLSGLEPWTKKDGPRG
jgi:multicomponent Na+:H+ antiporter subunit G